MQPYFFPFLGYYQMVNASDVFISYNDVNYIERGWINRNYVISPEGKIFISVPLVKASYHKMINEVEIVNTGDWKEKLKKTIYFTYKKAQNFNQFFPIVESVIDYPCKTIDEMALNSIVRVFEYLEIKKEVHVSSQLDYNRDADKVDKIVSLAKVFNAQVILFPSGSKKIYTDEQFESKGYQSLAVLPRLVPYQQFNRTEFSPGLSIIDVLMFNLPDRAREMVSIFNFEKLND